MLKSNIIITGASGYLGANYCESLLKKTKWQPIPLLRNAPTYLSDWLDQFPNVIRADITQKAELEATFGQLTEIPDAIVHFASVDENICAQDLRRAIEVNGIGAQQTYNAAAKLGVPKFVLISTFHVYGTPTNSTITEETPAYPVHNYGITHLLGEMLCQNSAQKYPQTQLAVLRLSNGFGPPLRPQINRWTLVVNDLCRQAVVKKKLTLKTAGNQRRDFICLDDIFQAINLLLSSDLKSGDKNIFNVGSGNIFSILEIAQKIQAIYKKEYGQKLPTEILDATPQKSLLSFQFDFSKIEALGYKSKGNFDQNVKKTLELAQYFRNNEETAWVS